jgi:hypothetical protein
MSKRADVLGSLDQAKRGVSGEQRDDVRLPRGRVEETPSSGWNVSESRGMAPGNETVWTSGTSIVGETLRGEQELQREVHEVRALACTPVES